MHREVAALRRAGLEVEVLGLGRADDAPPGTSVRTWTRGGMASRGLRAVSLPLRARGRVLLALDPDSALGALLVGRLRGRGVVADVHEDYTALLRDRSWARGVVGLVARLVARGAVRAAARADLTLVADEHLPPTADAARERLVVRNLPDLEHVLGDGEPRDRHGPDRATTHRAVYVGDLRTSRGLRTMVEAVAQTPQWRLDLVGPVRGDDADWLAARVDDPALAGRVGVHGRMPPARAWGIARDADVGLVLLDDTPAFRDAVPSKLLEYLAAGLAVLATPLPRVAALVDESGAGALVTGPDETASRLREWAEHPDRLAGHRRRARAWADEHLTGENGYDALAARVRSLVASVT